LQAALEEQEMENLFKTPKDNKVNIWIVIDSSVMGIETLLDIMTIALQYKREND